ncbi:Pycsar system effector family protein [Persicobacter diffluens]|uniref:HD/PDEase domain-containing protein n=1 Tax=Persicobacter diffluens TaxID=981 RepID=A0AAN5APE9_9BACT|nr:hypothetical protein PEDI_43150 [Persicobacter diffluens]
MLGVTKDKEALLKEVEEHVVAFYNEHIDQTVCTFHNFQHVLGVMEEARLIGKQYDISEQELFCLEVAAWFHDAGYSKQANGHERVSQEMARAFLTGKLPEEEIQQIEKLIDATRMDAKPEGLLACIMSDADFFHFHRDDFVLYSKAFMHELRAKENKDFEDSYYWKMTLNFMEMHRYKTDFAQKHFAAGKRMNMDRVRELSKGKKAKEEKKHKIKKEEKLFKKPSTERGIQSMFRLTSRNQISLSSIADNKANILLTVTSLIVSVGAMTGYPMVQENKELFIPLMLFLLTSLATLILAILSTRPTVTSGIPSDEDLKQKKVNLLFFGNFWRMEYGVYEKEVNRLMQDYDSLYNNMIKDQYFLGLVLAKKFKLLRLAYTVFMIGFTSSILAYLFVYFI